jgi:solute carrier family 12 sodium/potassium/chloride transporter 2
MLFYYIFLWLNFRYAGGFSASLSSAIASLVGAPRVLQAVGVDKLYPGVHWFAYASNANNDPYRGYILVFIVAFALAMVAELNAVGIIASNFFLAAYALMNLSCFHSAITKSPGWRPAFR